jgi:hypothetical protein
MNTLESFASPSSLQTRRARNSSKLWLRIGVALSLLGGTVLLGLLQAGVSLTPRAAQAATSSPLPTVSSTAPDTSVPDAATVLKNASDEAPAPQAF